MEEEGQEQYVTGPEPGSDIPTMPGEDPREGGPDPSTQEMGLVDTGSTDPVWDQANIEAPDVWDQWSQQILDELEGVASGDIKIEAEKSALEMGRKLSVAGRALMKSRRGIAPGAAFSTGAQQGSLVRGVGRQVASSIGKKAREGARTQALQFRAAKASEQRGIAMQIMQMQQAAAIAAEQASAGLFGSFLSFLGSVAMGFIVWSDERIKTNIDHKRGNQDLMDFLGNLETATYDKNMFGLTRHETGIMAQSAERSKVGKQFVQEVNGIKMLNPDAATGPILASLKLLHDRLGELEKQKKKKKRGKK